jgi:NAD(P)-dependent dehydrogenase (short-subunit alcohol dehydrogenase family)
MDLCWFRYITFIFVRDYGLPYQLIPSPAGCLTSAWPVASSASRVVVSNADNGLFGAAEEVTDAQIDHQTATNLIGSIQFTRAGIPHLRQQGGGEFVQVSSEGGQIAYPAFSLYHATKWGIEGFIESAAQEVAPLGIDFIIVEPGPDGYQFRRLVRASPTDIYKNTPAGRIRPLEEYARRKNTPAGRIRPLEEYARWCDAPGYCRGKLCRQERCWAQSRCHDFRR